MAALNVAFPGASRKEDIIAPTEGRAALKSYPAFGRKPLNFRIPSGLAATLEQPWLIADSVKVEVIKQPMGGGGAAPPQPLPLPFLHTLVEKGWGEEVADSFIPGGSFRPTVVVPGRARLPCHCRGQEGRAGSPLPAAARTEWPYRTEGR